MVGKMGGFGLFGVVFKERLNKQGYNQTFIAKSMGRNKSTISRELSRNTGKRGYRHKQANRLADERHQKNKAIKLTDCVKNYISEKLKEYWSPEQIMGRLELDKKIKISTETAYRFVLQDKAVGGALYKY
ncbi:Mobile element protein, partial [thiotrophic endosymbiont of Bathymodiolus puteoserpentis (Logatchev)]